MAYKLTWAPSALLDLREIALYIAESRPEVARRFVRSVFESIVHLTEFPEAGRIVPELGDPVIREVVRKPCRIVYRVKSDSQIVEIVRVWHAARGTPQL